MEPRDRCGSMGARLPCASPPPRCSLGASGPFHTCVRHEVMSAEAVGSPVSWIYDDPGPWPLDTRSKYGARLVCHRGKIFHIERLESGPTHKVWGGCPGFACPWLQSWNHKMAAVTTQNAAGSSCAAFESHDSAPSDGHDPLGPQVTAADWTCVCWRPQWHTPAGIPSVPEGPFRYLATRVEETRSARNAAGSVPCQDSSVSAQHGNCPLGTAIQFLRECKTGIGPSRGGSRTCSRIGQIKHDVDSCKTSRQHKGFHIGWAASEFLTHASKF